MLALTAMHSVVVRIIDVRERRAGLDVFLSDPDVLIGRLTTGAVSTNCGGVAVGRRSRCLGAGSVQRHYGLLLLALPPWHIDAF